MGCDIHAMIERRAAKHWWLNAGDPDIQRNYELFGILAGIRVTAPHPLSVNRGLPDDVCDEFDRYSQAWAEDGHSHGWVTLRELHEYPHTPAHERTKRAMSHLLAELERVADRCDGDTNAVRIVFFFDN